MEGTFRHLAKLEGSVGLAFGCSEPKTKRKRGCVVDALVGRIQESCSYCASRPLYPRSVLEASMSRSIQIAPLDYHRLNNLQPVGHSNSCVGWDLHGILSSRGFRGLCRWKRMRKSSLLLKYRCLSLSSWRRLREGRRHVGQLLSVSRQT